MFFFLDIPATDEPFSRQEAIGPFPDEQSARAYAARCPVAEYWVRSMELPDF